MENEQIQQLLDVNPDPVFIADNKTGKILFHNRVFSKKINVGDNLADKNLFDITLPSEKEYLRSVLDGKETNREIHFRMSDGRLINHKLYADNFDSNSRLISFKDVNGPPETDFHGELLDYLNDAVISTNFRQEIISWNKGAERMYGWTAAEALGTNIDLLLHTEMTDQERDQYRSELKTKGLVQQLFTRRDKNNDPVFAEASIIAMRDNNGRIGGYIYISRDITSRLKTLEKLRLSEERYKKLFDDNPFPIIIYSEEDYSIVKVNKSAADKYGYTFKEFRELKVPDLVAPEQRHLFGVMRLTENDDKHEGNFYTVKKSGERFFIEYTSTKITYKDYPARLVVMNDITEKQKAEEKMRDSSSKLETILGNLPIVLFELDANGEIILSEGKTIYDAGLSPTDITGKKAVEFAGDMLITRHNGQVLTVRESIPAAMKGEIISGRAFIADRYFDNYLVPVKKNGSISGLLGICLDITERVNLEKSYQITEERFRLIADNTNELIAMVSEGKYIYVSPSYERVLGYTIDEIEGSGPLSLVHHDDLVLLKNWQEKGLVEFRVRNKKGEWLWIVGESFIIRDDPKIVVGIASDITKRKLAEEKVKESEERYRLLFESNPLPMFVYDEETLQFIAANESAVTHYGYSKDEFHKMKITEIRPPEDIPLLLNNIASHVPGMNRAGVWRHMKKDGTTIDVDITTHEIAFNGRPSRIVLANDVTEKVKAEKALRESEEKYRRIVENADEGILLIDKNEKISFVNSKLAGLIGYTREEAENQPVIDYIFEEDRMEALNYVNKVRSGMREKFEFRIKHRDGSERWVKVNAVPVFDENNNYAGGLAFATDITRRREAEMALQKTNEMLRALINYSPLGIIILDKEGRTELWNPASEKMFGWSSKEALGETVPFVPPEKEEEHLELRNTVLRGESFTGKELVRKRRDGKKIDISVSAAPLFDSDHHAIGISSFIMDITDKKAAEKEREKLFRQITSARNRLKILSAKLISVQETEKRNISRELHDEIGQMLTALKIDLQRIKNGLKGKKIISLVDDCTSLVEKTISVVRNLSLELRPSIIDDLGLAASLRWYADKFYQRTGIEVKTEIKKTDKVLPPECAITLFRICQEALTNIAKHSEADYVKVSLNQNKSYITLTVEDNGKGFDLQKALKLAVKGKSLGLLGMQERAELLGGRFRIRSTEGLGTTIKASCQVQNI